MVEQIITKLKEELVKNKNAGTLYNKYIEKKNLEEQIKNNENEISLLLEEKRILDEQLSSYNAFQSLFKRKEILTIKEKIKNIEIKIETIRNKLEQNKDNFDKIQLSEEEYKILEEYLTVLDMEKDYSSGRYNEVIDGILYVFNSDFRNLISFCKENNISLNFVDYDSEEKTKYFGINFIDKFNKAPDIEKYSDLSQLCLVRKVNMAAIPKGDMVIPALSNKVANEVSTMEVVYDGKRYSDIEFEYPSGHLTISWYMNACVADHSQGSWSDRDVVIIQPMNERIYNEAAGLSPVDIIFEDSVKLENYFVICDSEEKKKEIEANNKDVTVFVLKMEDYGRLPGELGYYQLFKDYDGYLDETYKGIGDLYEEEFLKKYPKFYTHLERGPHNVIHNLSRLPSEICRLVSKLDFVIDKASEEESFEDSFRKILEAMSSASRIVNISALHEHNMDIQKIFVQGDREYISFLSRLIAMDKFEPEVVFELLMDGVTVTPENENNLLKVKEEVILTILKYNNDMIKMNNHDYEKKRVCYDNLVSRLFALRKIITSNVVNKKCTASIDYNQLIEYCDFTRLLEYCNKVVYSNFNENKNLDDCWEKIECVIEVNAFKLSEYVDFNLSNAQNSINDFIDKFIYISKIKDKNKMMQEIDNIFGDLLNEDGMEIFRLWAKDYSRASDLENKLLYLSLPIAYIMSNDLELNRQENKEIKR